MITLLVFFPAPRLIPLFLHIQFPCSTSTTVQFSTLPRSTSSRGWTRSAPSASASSSPSSSSSTRTSSSPSRTCRSTSKTLTLTVSLLCACAFGTIRSRQSHSKFAVDTKCTTSLSIVQTHFTFVIYTLHVRKITFINFIQHRWAMWVSQQQKYRTIRNKYMQITTVQRI